MAEPLQRRIPVESLEPVVACSAQAAEVYLAWRGSWCSGVVARTQRAFCCVIEGCSNPDKLSLCAVTPRPKNGYRPPERLANWKPLFIHVLATTGSVSTAAEQSGVGRRTAYEHRDVDPAFARDWDLAREASELGLDGYRRADLIVQGRAGAVSGVLAYCRPRKRWYWIDWTQLVAAASDKYARWDDSLECGEGCAVERPAINFKIILDTAALHKSEIDAALDDSMRKTRGRPYGAAGD